MNEKLRPILFKVFAVCATVCAALVLYGIWTGAPDTPDNEPLMKIIGTLFVIGLLSFLFWFSGYIKNLRAPKE